MDSESLLAMRRTVHDADPAILCYHLTISTRELDRVTLHCKFGVSPLEIGGFRAVPPSPPDIALSS